MKKKTMANFVLLTRNRLSVEAVTDLVTAPNTGAVSLFVGTTRDHFQVRTQVSREQYTPVSKKKIPCVSSIKV